MNRVKKPNQSRLGFLMGEFDEKGRSHLYGVR